MLNSLSVLPWMPHNIVLPAEDLEVTNIKGVDSLAVLLESWIATKLLLLLAEILEQLP